MRHGRTARGAGLVLFPVGIAMRIALGVEYDGGALRGWQTQPGGGTVQDELEAALGHIAGGKIAGSSRTSGSTIGIEAALAFAYQT